MRAGDIKKFLEKVIFASGRDQVNPKDFSINDNFLLSAFSAYKKGDPPGHLRALVEGFIETETLTVKRRIAVLKMMRDVFVGLSEPNITKDERQRLCGLLTAYFI